MNYNKKINEITILITINKKLIDNLPNVDDITQAISGLDIIKQSFDNGAYNDAGGAEIGNLDRGHLKPNYNELNLIKDDIISLKAKINAEINNLEEEKKQLEIEKRKMDLEKYKNYYFK